MNKRRRFKAHRRRREARILRELQAFVKRRQKQFVWDEAIFKASVIYNSKLVKPDSLGYLVRHCVS